ncbi:MAG: rcc01693 family protein [Pseudomonadota bacterium]
MTAFDWAGMMRLGLSELRLPPETFWRLTPAELQMMVAPMGPAPMGQAGLEALMARYPDEMTEAFDG